MREKQERFYEEKLTCDNVRQELGGTINDENKRVNIDSAKKRAVLQHMDYDGFHQMVLGANLKPIKKGEAESIYKHQMDTPLNAIASMGIIAGGRQQAGYDEEVVRRLLQMNLEEQLQAPRSQQEFEKYFCKKFASDAMQRYTYLRLMELSHYKTIFIADFDSEMLIKVMETFKTQVILNPAFNNETE